MTSDFKVLRLVGQAESDFTKEVFVVKYRTRAIIGRS